MLVLASDSIGGRPSLSRVYVLKKNSTEVAFYVTLMIRDALTLSGAYWEGPGPVQSEYSFGLDAMAYALNVR